jgi:hypothetical protein
VPYVVTTKRPQERFGEPGCVGVPNQTFMDVVSRRAVATLEEACGPYALPPDGHDESMAERTDRATTYDYVRLWDTRSQPRTLLDGTVIEVERVTWPDLAHRAGEGIEARHVDGPWPRSHLESHRRTVLAAFNSVETF